MRCESAGSAENGTREPESHRLAMTADQVHPVPAPPSIPLIAPPALRSLRLCGLARDHAGRVHRPRPFHLEDLVRPGNARNPCVSLAPAPRRADFANRRGKPQCRSAAFGIPLIAPPALRSLRLGGLARDHAGRVHMPRPFDLEYLVRPGNARNPCVSPAFLRAFSVNSASPW